MKAPKATRGVTLRGFTLIELMIVSAMMGILASMAIPEYTRLNLRARTGERRTVMIAITRTMSDYTLSQGRTPNATGNWNPAVPRTVKQDFDARAANWELLNLQIEGRVYYSYKYVSNPAGRNPVTGATQPTLDVSAAGDLDGDGNLSTKTISYVGFGHAYQLVTESPPEGAEDEETF